MYLKDSLIQTFMVTFAKEDCYNLLTNTYLIEITL